MATALPGVGWGTLIVTLSLPGVAAGDLPFTTFGVAFEAITGVFVGVFLLGDFVGVFCFGDLVGVFCLGDFVGVFCFGDFVALSLGDLEGVFSFGDLVGVFCFGDFVGVFCLGDFVAFSLGDFEGVFSFGDLVDVFCFGDFATAFSGVLAVVSVCTFSTCTSSALAGACFGDLGDLTAFTFNKGFGDSTELDDILLGVLPFLSGVVGGSLLSNNSGRILGPNDTRDFLALGPLPGVADFLF